MYYTHADAAEWVRLIKSEYSELRGLPKDTAKDRYLGMAQDLPAYGSTIFRSLSSPTTAYVPATFDLAVNAKVNRSLSLRSEQYSAHRFFFSRSFSR
jgi:hypothetical protein